MSNLNKFDQTLQVMGSSARIFKDEWWLIGSAAARIIGADINVNLFSFFMIEANDVVGGFITRIAQLVRKGPQ